MNNTRDTDGFYECVDNENDEFQSFHDGSDRSDLDSSNWNLDSSMATSDESSASVISGEMSSDRSGRSGRASVSMYGNDFKVEVQDVYNLSGHSDAFEDSEMSYASDSQAMDETMDTGNLADESYKNTSLSKGHAAVSPNSQKLAFDNLTEGVIVEETPPRSNATGSGNIASATNPNPSYSLLTGTLLALADHPSDEQSAGTISTQDSLLTGDNVQITQSLLNDDNVSNPPLVQRRRALPDINTEDDYTVASAYHTVASSESTTDSSVGTSDSFQSVFSDMSKLRSLMRGEMDTVFSVSGGSTNTSNRSTATEMEAAKMIAEELTKIEAQEKAEKMITGAAKLMLKQEIANINKQEEARIFAEASERRSRSEMGVSMTAKGETKRKIPEGEDRQQTRREKEEAAKKRKAEKKFNIEESVARVTHAENELKRLEREARLEQERKEMRYRAETEAAKIRYEDEESKSIEFEKKNNKLKIEEEQRQRTEEAKEAENARISAKEEVARIEVARVKVEEAERLRIEAVENSRRSKAEEEERLRAELEEQNTRLEAEEVKRLSIEAEQAASEIKAEEEEHLRLVAEEETRLKAEEKERLRIEAEKEAAKVAMQKKKSAHVSKPKQKRKKGVYVSKAEKKASRLKAEEEVAAKVKTEIVDRQRIEAEQETASRKAEEAERIRIEAEQDISKLEIEEQERIRIETEEKQTRLKAKEEEQDCLRIEAEASKRKAEEDLKVEEESTLLAKIEEQDRLRTQAEEEECIRLKAEKESAKLQAKLEEEGRLRMEAEQEASQLKAEKEELRRIESEEVAATLKAEEEECLRIEVEQEATRLKAEEVERLRVESEQEASKIKAEEEERIRIESEVKDRLHAEAEQEALRLKTKEKECIRIKIEEDDRLRIEATEVAAKLESEKMECIRLDSEAEAARLKAEEEEYTRIEAKKMATRLQVEEEERIQIEEELEISRLQTEEENRLRIEAEDAAAKQKIVEETSRLEAEEDARLLVDSTQVATKMNEHECPDHFKEVKEKGGVMNAVVAQKVEVEEFCHDVADQYHDTKDSSQLDAKDDVDISNDAFELNTGMVLGPSEEIDAVAVSDVSGSDEAGDDDDGGLNTTADTTGWDNVYVETDRSIILGTSSHSRGDSFTEGKLDCEQHEDDFDADGRICHNSNSVKSSTKEGGEITQDSNNASKDLDQSDTLDAEPKGGSRNDHNDESDTFDLDETLPTNSLPLLDLPTTSLLDVLMTGSDDKSLNLVDRAKADFESEFVSNCSDDSSDNDSTSTAPTAEVGNTSKDESVDDEEKSESDNSKELIKSSVSSQTLDTCYSPSTQPNEQSNQVAVGTTQDAQDIFPTSNDDQPRITLAKNISQSEDQMVNSTCGCNCIIS